MCLSYLTSNYIAFKNFPNYARWNRNFLSCKFAYDFQKTIHHCKSSVSSYTFLTTQFTVKVCTGIGIKLWKDNFLKPRYYVTLIDVEKNLTLFRRGLFMAAHDRGRGKKTFFPKIFQIYSTMVKLGTVIPYLKKMQQIFKSRGMFLEFCWHQHF